MSFNLNMTRKEFKLQRALGTLIVEHSFKGKNSYKWFIVVNGTQFSLPNDITNEIGWIHATSAATKCDPESRLNQLVLDWIETQLQP